MTNPHIRDYINEQPADLLEKIGIVALGEDYKRLYEHFVLLVEAQIAMLHLPDAPTPETRLDFFPPDFCTEIAEQIDLRFPHLTIVAKAVLWNELTQSLFTTADRLFVEKLRAKFMKESGVQAFLDALNRYGRK